MSTVKITHLDMGSGWIIELPDGKDEHYSDVCVVAQA